MTNQTNNYHVLHKKVLIIDNYDSFTYNLKQIIDELIIVPADILKNDAITPEAVKEYDYIFISPGPGLPNESNNLIPVLAEIIESKKIFGVCLGLQAIIEVCGGKLKSLQQVSHGIQSKIRQIEPCPVYNLLDSDFVAGRYHSWVVDASSIPESLIVNSVDDDGNIMGLHHKVYPVFGVQFHPESIMTPDGKQIISNFLNQ